MRYHELVIEGPRGWGIGFLSGYLSGCGSDQMVLDGEEEGFDVETLREQIREILVPTAEILHLVAPRAVVPHIHRAVKVAASRGRGMTIRHERVLTGASFSFEFCIYSRDHASRLRRRFDHLPPGARLTQGSHFTEVRDPDARGLEMYAPVHQYELRGEGGVEGDLEAVLPIFRLCRDEELVHVFKAELIGGEKAARDRKKKRGSTSAGR
jgi:hypothetical protein